MINNESNIPIGNIGTKKNTFYILNKLLKTIGNNPIDGSKIIYEKGFKNSLSPTPIIDKYPNAISKTLFFIYNVDCRNLNCKYESEYVLNQIYTQKNGKITILGYDIYIKQIFNDKMYTHTYKLDKYY